MRKRFVVLIGAVALAAIAVGFAVTSSAQRSSSNRAFVTVLDGRSEIGEDGRRGAGDRNGGGAFSAILDGRELCYGIQVKNIVDPNAAHIHRGRPNQNGPIVHPLEPPESGDPGASADCTTLEAGLARSIRRNPARFYVNVHNEDFPNGAVRGQLRGEN